MKRLIPVLGVVAVSAALGAPTPAYADFKVTDERTGQSFIATQYYLTPYECAAPCAFTFEAIQACWQGNPNFTWGIRDAADRMIWGAAGRSWRYEFTALGDYSVWESESAVSAGSGCSAGGTFKLRALDKTPPDTAITGGPSGVTDNITPSFSFTASEPGAAFACSFDDGAFATCASPVTAPLLGAGDHVFRVQAIDAAGNTDPTPARLGFRVVDRTAPALQVTAPASRSMRTALLRGLSIPVMTDEVGRVVIRLVVDRATARRFKIEKNARDSVTVGAVAQHIGIGKTVVKVRLSLRARSRLRHATRVRLRIVSKITDAAGNHRTKTFRITLK